MNKKIWTGISFVVGIALTATVTHYVTKTIATVEDGAQALDDQRLRTIIQEELQTANTVDIDGETLTYGQALSKISRDVNTLTTTVEIVLD